MIAIAPLVVLSLTMDDPAIPVRIVPTPQKAIRDAGSFDLKGASIVLARPEDPDDRFAARQLQEEAKTRWGIRLPIRNAAKKRILIGQIGRDRSIGDALAAADPMLPSEKAHDAYVLSIRPEEVAVAGRTAAGTFYGIQTLRQIVRQTSSLPCLRVSDWAALQYRGWQDDVSRGPIPTLEYLKKQVRTLSEYKLNCMTLYTEHVFKLKKHPTIAPADGLTADEIRELSSYAKKYHVEVIGNFQSFGHFANILNVKGYGHLGEVGWVLSPAKEESYQFLKDVYAEIAPAYESPLFNINCDETGGLGDGASKEMVQRMGLAAVYAQHINRIADLLRPLGKTPMMWGDIAQQHPDIVPRLPKDLIVLSWGYHAGNNFDGAILPFTRLGLRFWVCPGVSCWNQIFPDYRNASINISNYVRDGYRNGAMGMLNTTWDDDGENLFSNNWLPLVWGAECAWNPALPSEGDWNEERDRRFAGFLDGFDVLFHGSEGPFAESLMKLSELRRNPASGGMADGAFWLSLDQTARSQASLEQAQALVNDANAVIETLTKAKPMLNPEAIDYAVFAARRARFVGKKLVAARLLEDAAGNETIRAGTVTAFKELASEANKLRDEYKRLWLAENRKWWLDRNLAKYDALAKTLASVLEGPTISPKRANFEGTLLVRIGVLQPGLQIRFTMDGSAPKADSTLYVEPVPIDKTVTVKAQAFRGADPVGPIVQQTYRTTPMPARLSTNMRPFEGNSALCAWDGDPSTFFWKEGPAQEGDWLTVSFPTAVRVEEIVVPTGHPDGGRDQLQSGVLEASEDGKTWPYSTRFEQGMARLMVGGKEIRAFRIRVTASQGYWLVVREITVR